MELQNYIETQDREDYNVLDVRRLMAVYSYVSYSPPETRNTGAPVRYHWEASRILFLMSHQKYRRPAWILPQNHILKKGFYEH